jgi:hypothetical protein
VNEEVSVVRVQAMCVCSVGTVHVLAGLELDVGRLAAHHIRASYVCACAVVRVRWCVCVCGGACAVVGSEQELCTKGTTKAGAGTGQDEGRGDTAAENERNGRVLRVCIYLFIY